MKLCKDCEHFNIRMEYENEYNWGMAECKKYNLVTDFRTKKKGVLLPRRKQKSRRVCPATFKQIEEVHCEV